MVITYGCRRSRYGECAVIARACQNMMAERARGGERVLDGGGVSGCVLSVM